MPSNLNALIRYRTIDSRLSGGYRKYTFDELLEACSGALAEYRGRYEKISARTLRDDIRVMRSDILGFNAPIICSNGLYYYDDPSYSIFKVGVNNDRTLMNILELLEKARKETENQWLGLAISGLRKTLGMVKAEEPEEEYPAVSEAPPEAMQEEKPEEHKKPDILYRSKTPTELLMFGEEPAVQPLPKFRWEWVQRMFGEQ